MSPAALVLAPDDTDRHAPVGCIIGDFATSFTEDDSFEEFIESLGYDRRKQKKHLRRQGLSEVVEAYGQGIWYSEQKPNARCPYPPGKRRDAWHRGRY